MRVQLRREFEVVGVEIRQWLVEKAPAYLFAEGQRTRRDEFVACAGN